MTRHDRRRLVLILLTPLPLLLLPILAGIQWFYSLGVLGRVMATPFIASGLWLSPGRTMINTGLGAAFWYIMGMVVVASATSRRDRLSRGAAILAILAAVAVVYLGVQGPVWVVR